MIERTAFRVILWLWGSPLGKLVEFRSWSVSWGKWGCKDWREWGPSGPWILIDRNGTRSAAAPIWNWKWFRNRLGYGPKLYDTGAM